MSSTYRLICLNHDPALVIYDHDEWNDPEPAIAAATSRMYLAEHFPAHVDCDLMVGRFSYPLIELCCPSGDHHGGHHGRPEWMRREWLRLLYAAFLSPDATVGRWSDPLGDCWSRTRLHRLRAELFGDGEVPQPPAPVVVSGG